MIRRTFQDLDAAWRNVETRNFFLNLPAKQVVKLLSWRKIQAAEDSVLMAMLSWIRNRKQVDDDDGVVRALFTMLRVQCLSRTFFLGVLRRDPAFEPLVDDGVLTDVILYDAEQNKHRLNKKDFADDDMPRVRKVVPVHVMTWKVPVEKLAAASSILNRNYDSMTVTLRGNATFFAGVWWQLFLHMGESYRADEVRYAGGVAVGLVPRIKIDRIASVPESWSIVEHRGPVFDKDDELRMTGVIDANPDPDEFQVRSLHAFAASIVMDDRFEGGKLEDAKTFDCSGIQTWSVKPNLVRTLHPWTTENGGASSYLSIKVTMKVDAPA